MINGDDCSSWLEDHKMVAASYEEQMSPLMILVLF